MFMVMGTLLSAGRVLPDADGDDPSPLSSSVCRCEWMITSPEPPHFTQFRALIFAIPRHSGHFPAIVDLFSFLVLLNSDAGLVRVIRAEQTPGPIFFLCRACGIESSASLLIDIQTIFMPAGSEGLPG
ncbi:MAG: hypothetical protein AB1461_07165 [Thermodesulfobacteriota bacterium]